MKRLSTLEAFGLWARSHRWADLRRFPRYLAQDRFAGLKVRGCTHIVQIHNWSAGGACVDLPGDVALGEQVQLVTDRLRRQGRICWIVDKRAGIEFTD